MQHHAEIFDDGSVALVRDLPQMQINVTLDHAERTDMIELTPERHDELIADKAQLAAFQNEMNQRVGDKKNPQRDDVKGDHEQSPNSASK